MKDQNFHYIIQTENGLYWAGYNKFVDQIRKAQMYNSLKMAHKCAIDSIKRNRPASSAGMKYRVLKIEIHVIEEEDWRTIE